MLTVGTLRRAQASLWLNWPILTALSLTTSFAGIAIYSRYAGCDPLKQGRISSADHVFHLPSNKIFKKKKKKKFKFS